MSFACPDCPMCGQPPKFLLGDSQAICGNDDCACLMWNPSRTPAENLANVDDVDL